MPQHSALRRGRQPAYLARPCGSPHSRAAPSFSATSGSWRTCAWTTGGSSRRPVPTPARCWASPLPAPSSGCPRATARRASTATPGSWSRPTSARGPCSSASTPTIPTSWWPRRSRRSASRRSPGYPDLRREVKYGRNSRIDLLLECAKKGLCYVEIKNVHLSRRHGLAEFPDSVTARGAKHLAEMSDMVRAGHRAVMVFLIQRGEARRLALARDVDPGLRRGLRCGHGGRRRGDRAALQDERGGDPGRQAGADRRLTRAATRSWRPGTPSPPAAQPVRNLIPQRAGACDT